MAVNKVSLASGASPRVKASTKAARVKWATVDTINVEVMGAEDVAEDGSLIWHSYYCDCIFGFALGIMGSHGVSCIQREWQ